MTTPSYTTHADAMFDTEKPILGSTGLQGRDNLVSVAGGGVDAPKVLGIALSEVFRGTALSGSNVATDFDNMERARVITGSLAVTGGPFTFQVNHSDDGGVTFDGWQVITNSISANFTGEFTYDLVSGVCKVIGVTITNPMALVNDSFTATPLAGCNYIQLRMSAGTLAVYSVRVIEGVVD